MFFFSPSFLSTGELDGLHWGAGASRTSVPSASAQTSHEAVVDAAGEGATDLAVQLHMRAPEKDTGSSVRSVRSKRNGDFKSDRWIAQPVLKLLLLLSLAEGAFQCGSQPMSYKHMNIYLKSARKIRNTYKITLCAPGRKLSGPDSCRSQATECLLSELLLKAAPSQHTVLYIQKLYIQNCEGGLEPVLSLQ